jgi:hypothetical protein
MFLMISQHSLLIGLKREDMRSIDSEVCIVDLIADFSWKVAKGEAVRVRLDEDSFRSWLHFAEAIYCGQRLSTLR